VRVRLAVAVSPLGVLAPDAPAEVFAPGTHELRELFVLDQASRCRRRCAACACSRIGGLSGRVRRDRHGITYLAPREPQALMSSN
jgi:hypothetical protein